MGKILKNRKNVKKEKPLPPDKSPHKFGDLEQIKRNRREEQRVRMEEAFAIFWDRVADFCDWNSPERAEATVVDFAQRMFDDANVYKHKIIEHEPLSEEVIK